MPCPTHTDAHTHIFIIKLTVACACCSLARTLLRSALLQIKLILRKLLPANAAAIVLFALTNCFCFSAELELGSSSSCDGGRGEVSVALFSALLIVHCDCPVRCATTFCSGCALLSFFVVVRKLICAFYVTLLLLALTRY